MTRATTVSTAAASARAEPAAVAADEGDTVTGTAAPLGTLSWVAATGGQLTAAERRSLLRPIATTHAVNVVGASRRWPTSTPAAARTSTRAHCYHPLRR